MKEQKKALVFILLGQSNAVGHNLPMESCDIISEPLEHVYGLSRELNQTLHPEKLHFTGYLSAGMNLAEEQDNTYSLANCLAADWEKAANENPSLPDLYIVHIAIGAQGVGAQYMWNPDYPEKLIPGKLGTVDISLFPFTERILSLIKPYFEEKGIEYDILGVHFRGGENDTSTDLPEVVIPQIRPIYHKLFTMLEKSLGCVPKTVLYLIKFGEQDYINIRNYIKIENFERNVRANVPAINDLFREFAAEYPNISLFNPESLSMYDSKNELTCGIFLAVDGVHYSPEANREIADGIMKDYFDSLNK